MIKLISKQNENKITIIYRVVGKMGIKLFYQAVLRLILSGTLHSVVKDYYRFIFFFVNISKSYIYLHTQNDYGVNEKLSPKINYLRWKNKIEEWEWNLTYTTRKVPFTGII